MDIDITSQCIVGLEFSKDREALVYLCAPGRGGLEGRKIGLFDKSGFHYMRSVEKEGSYRVENGYAAHDGITWFKVFEQY